VSLPDRMCGVVLTGHGGPERLVWREDLPVPRPGPGEALVRVLAAGVNMTDVNTRTGWYARAEAPEGGWGGAIAFPRIQGADLCGRVVALGPPLPGEEARIAPGARVICPTNQAEPTADDPLAFRSIGSEFDGAFAEFCVVPVRHLYDVSASPLDDVAMGAVPCAYGTAMNLLDRAGVTAGMSVLVAGASGGVGLAAVELALRRGARVTGQCSAARAGPLAAAGAAHLDRDAPPPPARFDAVIDVVGGPGWAARLAALRPGGHYAVAGAVAGAEVTGDLRTIYLNDLTLHGVTRETPGAFARLVAMLNADPPRPLVSRTYPLRDIAAAQADLVAGRYPGKLVLLPPEAAA
jgi:alcohol dehydrogenase